MTRWWIYVLRDPEDGSVRYVGVTTKPKNRLAGHLTPSTLRHRNHRTHWIAKVLSTGKRPIMSIIDAGRGGGWPSAERAWIREYRARGVQLVNSTDGGGGMSGGSSGPLTQEHRDKIAAANRGRRRTPEQREANRQRNLGTKRSAETRAKMSASAQGKKKSLEHRMRIADGGRGRIVSTETREKISATMRARSLNRNKQL